MANQRPLISVICCAHNEEEYVDKSIPSILSGLKGFSSEVLFVADRCTDNTVDIVRRYNVNLTEKKHKKWENSYAESLQTGYLKANGIYVSIIDADIAVPINFFRDLLPMITRDIASVAADVVTYPDTFWNRVFHAWEKTYKIAPLGKKPRGAARIMLKKALDKIGGIQDVPTPDTNIDIRLAKVGYKSVAVSKLKTFHLRHLSLKKAINGQLTSGRARYALGISLKRTVGHSILRARPLILQGWMMERIKRKRKKSCKSI